LGVIYVDAGFAADLAASVLGVANVFSRTHLSRIQIGVLEAQLSNLLEEAGFAAKSDVAAAPAERVGALIVSGELAMRGCRGRIGFRLPEAAVVSVLNHPTLPEAFGKLSLSTRFQLAHTSIEASELASLHVGDAILFEDIVFPSTPSPWQVRFELPGFQLAGQLGAAGDLRLEGIVGPTPPEAAREDTSGQKHGPIALLLETAPILFSLRDFVSLLKGELVAMGEEARTHLFLRGPANDRTPVEPVWMEGQFGAKIIQPWGR
jgi:hypothetical protein